MDINNLPLDPRLVEYYRLCAIKPANERSTPLAAQLSVNSINAIFTKKTADLIFKQDIGGRIIYKETFVGAGKKAKIIIA